MKRLTTAFMVIMMILGSSPLVASTLPASNSGEESSLPEISPGSLRSLLPEWQADDSETLVLRGRVDARDFMALSELFPTGVKRLDLSELEILPYSSPSPLSDGRIYFPADELPAWSLFTLPVEDVALPRSLKSIGEGALAATRLRGISLPAGLEKISDYAFYDSPGLISVDIPASLSSIGKGAFSKCVRLQNIDLSATALSEIPAICFAGCRSLTGVSLPQSVRSVGSEAFRSAAVRELRLTGVVRLDDYALYGMPELESIVLNPGADFGKGVMMNAASLSNVAGAPDIIPALFAAGCPMLDISGMLTETAEIGAWGLSGTRTKTLTLSAASLLEEGALSDISDLELIDVRGLAAAVPAADEAAFEGVDIEKVTLLVDGNSREQWEQHPVWGRFEIVSDYLSASAIVDSADKRMEIAISYADGKIKISSLAPLESAAIFSPEGMLLVSESLSGTEAELPAAELEKRYVVIVVRSAGSVRAIKIKL